MRFQAFFVMAALLVASNADALTQPNGTVIPTAPGCNSNQPTGLLAAFACVCTTPGVCNIGGPCASATSCDDGNHGTCESTMHHAFNDNTCIPSLQSGLDPVAEAAVTPETFHPTCALTFTIVTRGTAIFKDAFGWYNVTGHKPDPSDLHPMLGCGDAPGATVTLNIQTEPAYKGGDIGFFLLSPEAHANNKQCASGNCCPSLARFAAGEGYVYYSERAYNPDQAGASSFIHLLTYGSHLAKRKFYFAWEDIYGGSNGDFTDLVTSVEGVECTGGGQACDTGKQGICAQGVTSCSQGCQAAVAPRPETCDGVDDDCNGMVDDLAKCPNVGDVCQNGKCVPHCGTNEFPCAGTTQCDRASGLCVESACVGVSCAVGKICQAGQCTDPCNGVVCPHGQSCVGNACLDLCKGVTCAAGQACREGSCFPGCASCDGVVCGSPLKCDPTGGDCVDPSCTTKCAAGMVCKAGTCVDGCDGAKCPNGQTCSNGQCGGPGQAGQDAGGLLGVDSADGGAATGPGAASGDDSPDVTAHGCACDVGRASRYATGGPLALLAVFLAWNRRRRRSADRR